MTNDLPIVPDSTLTERQGVHYVGYISSQIGFIWREVSNTDLGIDGYLEVIVSGAPIGLLAVQVKSGKSYMESPNDSSFIFRAEKKHVRYWLSYRLPVIVIVYDPDSKIGYWHFIQEYFTEHDDAPEGNSVPIKFSKSNKFHESFESLTNIASSPDSTAHAMLSLRASRYKSTRELLTNIEMVELYGKRKWLGEWLPLDFNREELLLHSSLGKRGPAWYWFRPSSSRNFSPYLKSALHHPDYLVRSEALLALSSSSEKETVSLIRELIENDEDVINAANAIALIKDVSKEEKNLVVNDLWQQLTKREGLWSRRTVLQVLSFIALFGGKGEREKVVERYSSLVGYTASTIVPRILRTAGFLWDKNELNELRGNANLQESATRTLAVAALAQIGEREDIPLLVEFITSEQWPDYEDRFWISKEISHLFNESDVDYLIDLLKSDYNHEIVAHPALNTLCHKLGEQTLLNWLNSPIPDLQKYGALGLIEAGKAKLLKPFESLLDSDFVHVKNIIAVGLSATGDWEIINRLLLRGDFRDEVAEGLRYVNDPKAQEKLFELLDDEDARLKASESLAIIGNEGVLQRIIDLLIENPYRSGTEVMLDLTIHIDRRLFSPVHWPENFERDFTPRRYSVRRYEEY